MGRRIPPYTSAPIHPAVSFSFVALCIASTTIVIAALCGARVRSRIRKSSAATSPPRTQDKTNVDTTSTGPKSPSSSPSPTASPATSAIVIEKNIADVQQLSPPITTPPHGLTIKTTRRKLSASLSMKMGGMGLPKLLSRKDEQHELKQSKSKPEDSLWTKTIMLGERCKVPDEDDAILYDEKGNRLSSYPVRTPRSLPISRSNSFIDKESLPM